MRKVREVLRLHYAAGMSLRAVARSLKVSPATVGKCIRRAEAQGSSWPLPDSLDDAGLERRLFPAPAPRGKPRPLPRWNEVHRELRGKSVTLALLWEEYKAVHPEGLQSSRFCEQYRAWASKLDVVMRQEHRAGEKRFVDYAGHTLGVVDRHTGELLPERRSSSRCSGRRATPMPRRRGRRACRTGLRRRRSAPAWGFCAWRRATARPASKQRRNVPWPSPATATAASSPSPDSGVRGQASPIASTSLHPSRSNPPPRSNTTTSAAPTTTPERTPTG